MVENKRTKKDEVHTSSGCESVTLDALQIQPSKKSIAPAAFSVWIRVLLQNWRQGTVGCKDRSEVDRTNKKPWKQKGTGRARAGTARSPLWRGGGVTFGPQQRSHSLKINKKVKKSVLATLLSDFVSSGKIMCLDWQSPEMAPSTARAFQALKAHDLVKKSLVLFLSHGDMLSYASFSNISGVKIVFFDHANAFDCSSAHLWVFLKKDTEQFKQMVTQWL